MLNRGPRLNGTFSRNDTFVTAVRRSLDHSIASLDDDVKKKILKSFDDILTETNIARGALNIINNSRERLFQVKIAFIRTKEAGGRKNHLHVHEVFPEGKIKELGDQQTGAAPDNSGRKHRNASEFHCRNSSMNSEENPPLSPLAEAVKRWLNTNMKVVLG